MESDPVLHPPCKIRAPSPCQAPPCSVPGLNPLYLHKAQPETSCSGCCGSIQLPPLHPLLPQILCGHCEYSVGAETMSMEKPRSGRDPGSSIIKYPGFIKCLLLLPGAAACSQPRINRRNLASCEATAPDKWEGWPWERPLCTAFTATLQSSAQGGCRRGGGILI